MYFSVYLLYIYIYIPKIGMWKLSLSLFGIWCFVGNSLTRLVILNLKNEQHKYTCFGRHLSMSISTSGLVIYIYMYIYTVYTYIHICIKNPKIKCGSTNPKDALLVYEQYWYWIIHGGFLVTVHSAWGMGLCNMPYSYLFLVVGKSPILSYLPSLICSGMGWGWLW